MHCVPFCPLCPGLGYWLGKSIGPQSNDRLDHCQFDLKNRREGSKTREKKNLSTCKVRAHVAVWSNGWWWELWDWGIGTIADVTHHRTAYETGYLHKKSLDQIIPRLTVEGCRETYVYCYCIVYNTHTKSIVVMRKSDPISGQCQVPMKKVNAVHLYNNVIQDRNVLARKSYPTWVCLFRFLFVVCLRKKKLYAITVLIYFGLEHLFKFCFVYILNTRPKNCWVRWGEV